MSRLPGGVVAALAAVALCLWRLGPGDPVTDALEARLYDLRLTLRGPLGPAPSTAVIAVDEAALAAAAPGAPLRRALAETVRALGAEGAAAVVVDFLLLDETEADAALADALRETPAAILAVASLEEGGRPLGAFDPESRAAIARAGFGVVIGTGDTPPPRPLAAPAPALLEAAPALGHVNVARAPDRVVRRAPLALELGDGIVLPGAPALAAARYLGLGREAMVYERGRAVAFGPRRVRVDALGRALIVHRGAAGVFDRVTLGAFLGGARPPGGVAGRMVFVGATAESLGDIAATPLDPDAPGVESLAALAAQIVEGRALGEGPRAAAATLALAAPAAALGWGAARIAAVGLAAAASLGVGAAAAVATQVALTQFGLAVDAAAALLSAGGALGAGWLFGRLRERRRAARLAPHVSPLLDAAERLGPGPRLAAVVFADMIGSTALVERMGPDGAAALLSAAQGRLAALAERHRGLVVEIEGDGAMLAFGLSPETCAADAARDALAFVRAVAAPGPQGARFRATAAYGPVVLADFGGARQRRLALAGDTVYAASRMQDVARRLGAAALATVDLAEAAGGAPGAVALPPEPLRGFAKPPALLRLDPEPDPPPPE